MRIVTRSFILRPDDRPDPVFSAYHLRHREAARTQAADAPHFDLPREGSRYPRSSLPALEAAKWVEAHAPGAFEAYDLALLEAFFGRSEDISDAERLVSLGRSAGVDPAGLREALAAQVHRRAVFTDHVEATERWGIHGVPAVLVPGVPPIIGAVPYAHYQQAVCQALHAGGPAEERDPETGKIIVGRGSAYLK